MVPIPYTCIICKKEYINGRMSNFNNVCKLCGNDDILDKYIEDQSTSKMNKIIAEFEIISNTPCDRLQRECKKCYANFTLQNTKYNGMCQICYNRLPNYRKKFKIY